eukprot:COSAG03_NODE_733_length_6057_cov_15.493958_4_plen_107_part_00
MSVAVNGGELKNYRENKDLGTCKSVLSKTGIDVRAGVVFDRPLSRMVVKLLALRAENQNQMQLYDSLLSTRDRSGQRPRITTTAKLLQTYALSRVSPPVPAAEKTD